MESRGETRASGIPAKALRESGEPVMPNNAGTVRVSPVLLPDAAQLAPWFGCLNAPG